ncbi:peptidase S41 [Bacteroidales bacterium]|nr:peptidase S41 [Bacteroidales bacterium]
MSTKKYFWGIPIIILFALLIGFSLGNYFASKNIGNKLFFSSGNKINVILDIINQDYVDSVNVKNLVEEAIPKIINELDPHSNYISAEDLEAVNEELDGHFSGIGVQFSLQQDTIMIVSVINGGPSEKAGLQAGDRVVTINDSIFVGPSINNEKVMKNLKGEKNTSVRLGIKRSNADDLIAYEIIRGDVPVNSVEAAYQVSDGIGLIKVSKFGKTTENEFVGAIAKLVNQGCESFIIDLRQNTGGLLHVAINMANEFLSKGSLIVYVDGKAYPKNEAYADGSGSCQNSPLVILMDEWSASASEVLAGAIQDNDRGLIIGRRSFGKGMVQDQIALSDGSALRLTIARYYSPSGRCIQKKYELGQNEDYELDLMTRFSHGEFDSQDSIKQETDLEYYTIGGRTVYGGGGIMPDIFIPRDTIGTTSYYNSLVNNGILHEFAIRYTDNNREKLKEHKDYESLWKYLKSQPLLEEVVEYATSKNIRKRPTLINISGKLINNLAQAYIIRNIFGDEAFYPVYLSGDRVVGRAVEAIKKGEAKDIANNN